MKKGKPIEPGCLAMCVNSERCPDNNGKVVHVLQWVQAGARTRGVDGGVYANSSGWLVEIEQGFLTVRTNIGDVVRVKSRVMTSRLLIRIDDGEQPQEENTTRERELTLSGEAV